MIYRLSDEVYDNGIAEEIQETIEWINWTFLFSVESN